MKIFFLVFLVFNLVWFFDPGLAIGFDLVVFLSAVLFLFFNKIGISDKNIITIFLISLFIHLCSSLFIYYTDFKPFGGGADYDLYHKTAVQIESRISQGDFSLDGLYSNHYFPVLVGLIYFLTLPELVIGQMFVAWLSAVTIVLVYLLAIEIGGQRKAAFYVSLAINFYASYTYFGSLLLKDTVVVPFVLLGLVLAVKMIKKFSWIYFLFFYIALTAIIHLRFYIGYALLFSFLFAFFLTSSFALKKRAFYATIVFLILGLCPYSLGYGYYGSNSLTKYFTKDKITTYREVVYAPPAIEIKDQTIKKEVVYAPPAIEIKDSTIISQTKEDDQSGSGSSFVVKTGFESKFTFIKNYFLSFIYSLFGPFPWQMQKKRQLSALVETIPWYLCFLIIINSFYYNVKFLGFANFLKKYKFTFLPILFAIMSFGALSLFINNYGIIARIRIPAIIAILSIMPLGFDLGINYKLKLKNLFRKFK